MRRKSRFQEQQEKKLRLETITKLFSSAAITVAAVVVVSVVVPTSPSAELVDVRVFSDRVSYRVDIVDPDMAIQNDSLRVRLSNQLEEYVTPLDFGYTIGAFDNLNPDTSYYLEVLANKGFGDERLASKRFVTIPKDGGAILATRTSFDEIQYENTLEVDIVTYNNENTYENFSLEYAIVYEYYETEPTTSSQEQEIEYIPVPITTSPETISISVPHYYSKILLRMIGLRSPSEPEVLDEVDVVPPFSLEAGFYVEQIGVNSISAYFYPDSRLMGNVEYTAYLYRGAIEVGKQQIDVPDVIDYESEHEFIITFKSLRPLTEYSIVLSATYIDPHTLREETTSLEPILATTLGTYQIDLEVIDLGDSYEVTATLIDPSHNFQELYYEIYVNDEHYPMYMGQTGFLSPEDKTGTLFITKPTEAIYRIEIGVRNTAEYFKYEIIHTIET